MSIPFKTDSTDTHKTKQLSIPHGGEANDNNFKYIVNIKNKLLTCGCREITKFAISITA